MNRFRTCFAFGAGVSLWMGIPLYGWAVYDWQAVEKILTAFAMPVGLIWSLLILGGLIAFARGRSDLAKRYFIFVLLLGVAGNSWIAGKLNGWIERPVVHLMEVNCTSGEHREANAAIQKELAQYPSLPLPSSNSRPPNYDVVVLLGGSTTIGVLEQPELAADGQRLLLAAQLYHAGRTPRLIATGGHPVFSRGTLSHAKQARVLLESIGVPGQAIECLEGRNTYEEMQALATHFRELDLPVPAKVGVITNATHMPRVMRLAEEAGLRLEPIPCLFLGQGSGFDVTSLIPSKYGISAMSTACYEILARFVGH